MKVGSETMLVTNLIPQNSSTPDNILNDSLVSVQATLKIFVS